ncbi:hypothetical protein [Xanthomonas campestris]|uniref:hypothetical protein n=1 Tax=Xanthomonas campestris TaxID=339 RepID=UPI001604584B|nr:hypothetical protein [Xanthomonas campestris]
MDKFTRVPEALRPPRTQQIRRLIQAVDRAWTRDDSKFRSSCVQSQRRLSLPARRRNEETVSDTRRDRIGDDARALVVTSDAS